eukprot:TRINITY_DN5031_c1_g3_i2.p1 TRINITY_DN5031_c1_g3~~TRINITY_DN5031_c1_g3_i2.p1  ORF type:complete len:215 (-),score=10.14 TRINITY_DN5031_c1_g3_i2:270-869(-)
MSDPFIRIKLIEVKIPPSMYNFTNEPSTSVNIMEKEVTPAGVDFVQKKKTFFPDWGRCFDSHIHDGRRMQIIIMDTPDTPVSQVTVELLTLAEHYRADSTGNAVKLALDLTPSGQIIMQVKVYGCLGGDEIHSDSQPFIPSSELPKNATALRGRRGAIKFGNANEVQGHLFLKKFFRQPVYCSLCHEFIWGFGKETSNI